MQQTVYDSSKQGVIIFPASIFILFAELSVLYNLHIYRLSFRELVHIPTRLLLSVVKNVIQLFFLIHPMISRIYIGWHRKVLCYMLNWLANLMDYRNMWIL